MKTHLTNATCILQLKSLARRMNLPYTKVIYLAINRFYKDYEAGNIRWEERQ